MQVWDEAGRFVAQVPHTEDGVPSLELKPYLQLLLSSQAHMQHPQEHQERQKAIEEAATPMEYALHGVKEAEASAAKKRELELLRRADQKEQVKAAIRGGDLEKVTRLLDAHPEFLDVELWPVTVYQAKSLPVTKLLLERGLAGAREGVLTATNDAGYMTRPAWVLNHRLPAFRDCERMPLTTAEDLEERLINIPSSAQLAPEGAR